MGTHGSMTIYTASDESDDLELSAYLVKLHTTHDGDAMRALRDALILPFFSLQEFENEAALALARGQNLRRCDWRARMALASTLINRRRDSPNLPKAKLDPEDGRALFLSQAFERCRERAEEGHLFSADPTDLCTLMTSRGSAGWFALPHQLDEATSDYWDSEPNIVIESGSSPLTRVSVKWLDPESDDERDEMFNEASRWVSQLNAALSPFSLYEIERREEGISVQYPFELVMTALTWHRAFTGGRLDPIENDDGPFGPENERSAIEAAFGLDSASQSIPAFGDLAFCFSSSTPASRDSDSVWAGMSEFIGARRPESETRIDKGGILIAIDFLRFEEPLLIRGALRSLAEINQKSEPGAVAAWLRSVMDALPETTRERAPEALAFLEQADLTQIAPPASAAKAQSRSI